MWMRHRYCRRIRWTWLGGLGPWAKAGWQSGIRAASNRIVPLRASTAVPSRAARRIRRQYLSYIWTREGWLYLAVVIDLYARRVVGWGRQRSVTQGAGARRAPTSPGGAKTWSRAASSFRSWRSILLE